MLNGGAGGVFEKVRRLRGVGLGLVRRRQLGQEE